MMTTFYPELREIMEELPGHLQGYSQSEDEIPLQRIIDLLQPVDITINDTLGEADNGFPGYLEGFGHPESGLTLDQFSIQITSIGDQSSEELNAGLGLSSYKDALKIVGWFGILSFGHVVEYQGVHGYDPERIWKSELSYCSPSDFERPPSAFLKCHNIGVYGSGGLPEPLRKSLKTETINSATLIEGEVRQYSVEIANLSSRSEGSRINARRMACGCGDVCKAGCTDNDHEEGHLPGTCTNPTKPCKAKYFKPKETVELVLFDTEREELVTAVPGALYVAVSHVWFQGLFGQRSRKCGKCILYYLRTACTSLGVRFAWIDTLCMPEGDDLRRKVIGQLRHIYFNAGATLVVDAGLIGLISTKAKSVLDLSLAILLSDWTSRIWTLQEGVLALKLLFCVQDQVLSLPQMSGLPHFLDTRNWVSSRLLKGYGLREDAIDMPLQELLSLAYGRQTSYPCDELYGLFALFPSTPINRAQDLEQVAIEVAQIYNNIDLGLLMKPWATDGCRREQRL
ncbi:unnamed protein product [Mortierella alpina]